VLHFGAFYTPQTPEKSISIPKNPPSPASKTVQKSEMLCRFDRIPRPRRALVFAARVGLNTVGAESAATTLYELLIG
jgi:hypothetical protein